MWKEGGMGEEVIVGWRIWDEKVGGKEKESLEREDSGSQCGGWEVGWDCKS